MPYYSKCLNFKTIYALAPAPIEAARTGAAGTYQMNILHAGLATQPSKKQLPIAFAKVASEAQRATQVWKKQNGCCS